MIRVVKSLFEEFVEKDNALLKYILTNLAMITLNYFSWLLGHQMGEITTPHSSNLRLRIEDY